MYSRGRDLGGRYRDYNYKRSIEWYAQSNMTLFEIRDEYIIYTSRAMSTIRRHINLIYNRRKELGRIPEQYFPSFSNWIKYAVRRNYYQQQQQNGTENE